MKPISFQVVGERWIRRNLWPICPPECDLSSLTRLGGSRLGFYELQAAADGFGGNEDTPPRTVMHCMVHIWAWPALWLLLLGDKFFAPPITSLTTIRLATGIHCYQVGHSDPERPGVVVVGIQREKNAYHIHYQDGDHRSLVFHHVDHASIQRGVTQA